LAAIYSNMKKINIITLGCPKNQDDTNNLSSFLLRKGFVIEPDLKKAEAVLVHTCSFIEDAKKESIETILKVSRQKRKGTKLFVTGCLVQQHGKELLKGFPEVDGFLGTGQLSKLVGFLKNPEEKFFNRDRPGGFFDPDGLMIPSDGKLTAYLRISEGCNHICSFCVIPMLRGPFISRSEEMIVREAKSLYSQGIREIILIGQDTGLWGKDLYGRSELPNLLRKLRALKFDWIRLMYMHPNSLTDETLAALAESPEIFTYLDLPLQHIDDGLLRKMKRKLFEQGTRELLEKIHKRLPGISLRTTFLVGYPAETEKEFLKLVNFVKEGHFDYAGSFAYSKEAHTPAGKSQRQIPQKVKEERQKIIAEAQYEVSEEKAKRRLGSVEKVLFEEKEYGQIFGRTAREAPEIDAVVKIPAGKTPLHKFAPIKLTGYDAYEFRGQEI